LDYRNLIFTKEDGIGIVTINRPEALNALNVEVFSELYAMFTEIENDTTIRVVILTGTGKAFVAGADIVEMKDNRCEYRGIC
jgi:enoyl-CoA hydratase